MARIGLLEDNTRIAKLCTTMLQYAGHDVTVYEHPRECLQALLPQTSVYGGIAPQYQPMGPLPVEILILDLYLPDISGIEVLHSLQSFPRTQALPLILCTAASSSEVARALSVVPRAGFVEKPFKLQALISAITKALNSIG